MNKPHDNKATSKRKLKGSRIISPEAATIATAFSIFIADKPLLHKMLILALTSEQQAIRLIFELLAAREGFDVEAARAEAEKLKGDPISKLDLIKLIKPKLTQAAQLVHGIHIIYPEIKEPTAEFIIYYFYAFVRWVHFGFEPLTKAQGVAIFELALNLALPTPVVSKKKKKLEAKSQVEYEDWLNETKQTAHKKFKTFVNQSKRTMSNAETTVDNILSALLGDEDDEETLP